MADKVSLLAIACMAVTGILSFVLPLGLLLYLKIKKGADLLPFFIGCAVMLLFALVLESLCHQLILMHSPVGETILGTPILYALYGGFMAGLFEETGRFLAFKTVLKKRLDKNVNALMYGAGHGGFEAMAIAGTTMLNNIVLSVMIDLGQTDKLLTSVPSEMAGQMQSALDLLVSTPAATYLLGGVERIFAIAIHIALSVLVFAAVKEKARGWLFPLAVFLHFFVDMVTAYLSQIKVPAILIEAAVGAMTVAVVLVAKAVWRRLRAEPARSAQPGVSAGV